MVQPANHQGRLSLIWETNGVVHVNAEERLLEYLPDATEAVDHYVRFLQGVGTDITQFENGQRPSVDLPMLLDNVGGLADCLRDLISPGSRPPSPLVERKQPPLQRALIAALGTALQKGEPKPGVAGLLEGLEQGWSVCVTSPVGANPVSLLWENSPNGAAARVLSEQDLRRCLPGASDGVDCYVAFLRHLGTDITLFGSGEHPAVNKWLLLAHIDGLAACLRELISNGA
jgi:hypothetical protein